MTGLRRYLVDDPAAEAPERCEMCATPVPSEHPHLVQVAERRLLCVCGPCGFLFDNPGAGGGGYARVPDRYLVDPAFALTDRQWDALQIPVGMAFFLHNTVRGSIVMPATLTVSVCGPRTMRGLFGFSAGKRAIILGRPGRTSS